MGKSSGIAFAFNFFYGDGELSNEFGNSDFVKDGPINPPPVQNEESLV